MPDPTDADRPTRRELMAGAAAGLSMMALSTLTTRGDGPTTAPIVVAGPDEHSPDAWYVDGPRDEIRPRFDLDPAGGPEGRPALVIAADARPGLDGCWTRPFPVVPGKHYRFSAVYRADRVALPRRSVVAKIDWRDAAGKPVPLDGPVVPDVLPGMRAMAETEFPAAAAAARADGWTEVAGTYRVPARATQAVVRLHLQWAPDAEVRWADVSLTETRAPAPRLARLAAVHFRPKGGRAPIENCVQFEPLIAQAARQRADLVVLGETLTYAFTGEPIIGAAEPIPWGTSTKYFGELAKRHDLYIVAGLVERDGHLVYNVAVLIGPDGSVVGKYRKTCLPRSEVDAGICPGTEYPVFDTRFGKVGMMVCYDGFFPEVARELANRGAEVIAWPVWGCNPLLARARACENHVYVVSSTYEDVTRQWMVSAVFDHAGRAVVQAEKWGTVVVAEVDLNARTRWPSLGDFRAQLPAHRPVVPAELPKVRG